MVNNTLDLGLASKISEIFCEVIIAPGFTEDARELFAKKKNLRLLVSKSDSDRRPCRKSALCRVGILPRTGIRKK